MTEHTPTGLEHTVGMSNLDRTQELYDLLQGTVPDGYKIPDADVPRLTADQAWTVVCYLGNQYWQVPDHIERCGICGWLYDSNAEGESFDGVPPHNVCDGCCETDEAHAARRIVRRRDEAWERQRKRKERSNA
jgi:hypothetical protein